MGRGQIQAIERTKPESIACAAQEDRVVLGPDRDLVLLPPVLSAAVGWRFRADLTNEKGGFPNLAQGVSEFPTGREVHRYIGSAEYHQVGPGVGMPVQHSDQALVGTCVKQVCQDLETGGVAPCVNLIIRPDIDLYAKFRLLQMDDAKDT